MGKSKIRIARVLLLLLISISVTGIYTFWPRPYKWVFIYYMSYDNDLEVYGRTILRNLAQGISDKKIAVLIQADFTDSGGMKRIALYHFLGITERKDILLQSEDSADPNELRKYLDWVRDNWKAENYCVVFLNHGGLLNSMCKDVNPFRQQSSNDKPASEKWLSAMEVGSILADFNRGVGGKVRLLFLQQCARGSIQNLYSFADTSQYIMASPIGVGAPNTYYTKMIQETSNDPNITGRTIAQTIMREDKDYTLYTLLDCNEMEKLPEMLESVLDAFKQVESLESAKSCEPFYEYEDEKFYDLKVYLETLSSVNNGIAEKELKVFFDWCDNHLIIDKQYKDYKPDSKDYIPPDKSWRSGLSIYVPSDPNQLGRYDFLPLYKQTKLENLMRLSLQ